MIVNAHRLYIILSSICLFVCLPVYLSISVIVSVYLSVYLSLCLCYLVYAYTSVYMYPDKHTHTEARGGCWVSYSNNLSCFLFKWSYWFNWSFHLGWSDDQWSPMIFFSKYITVRMQPHLTWFFFPKCWKLNWGSHFSAISTFTHWAISPAHRFDTLFYFIIKENIISFWERYLLHTLIWTMRNIPI